MVQRHSLANALFSKDEEKALRYVGIDPTDQKYNGVFPVTEAEDKLVEFAQSLLDRKFALFKSAFKEGIIEQRHCTALKQYYEDELDDHGSRGVLKLVLDAEELLLNSKSKFSKQYRALYEDQERFGRCSLTLEVFINATSTQKTFN